MGDIKHRVVIIHQAKDNEHEQGRNQYPCHVFLYFSHHINSAQIHHIEKRQERHPADRGVDLRKQRLDIHPQAHRKQ